MNTEKFKSDMTVFSLKHHQQFIVYLDLLEEKGWTIDDAREYVRLYKEDLRKRQKELKVQTYIDTFCPICQDIMLLYPVNISNSTMTGDPEDKSVWICRNKECMETIYSEKSVEDFTKKESDEKEGG